MAHESGNELRHDGWQYEEQPSPEEQAAMDAAATAALTTDYHADSRISNAEYKVELAVTEMMETLCDLGSFSLTPTDAADKVRQVVGDTLNKTMGLD